MLDVGQENQKPQETLVTILWALEISPHFKFNSRAFV